MMMVLIRVEKVTGSAIEVEPTYYTRGGLTYRNLADVDNKFKNNNICISPIYRSRLPLYTTDNNFLIRQSASCSKQLHSHTSSCWRLRCITAISRRSLLQALWNVYIPTSLADQCNQWLDCNTWRGIVFSNK